MPTEILMPALSPTMTEGALTKWCKAEGDKVRSGDVIAEIETDKAVMELEAPEDGILGKILVPAGTKGVKINSAVGMLLLKGEDKAVLSNIATKAKEEPKQDSNSSSDSMGIQSSNAAPKEALPSASTTSSVSVSSVSDDISRIFASPLAKRIAAQNDVVLDLLEGSGPKGRIVKADVLTAINNAGGIQQRTTTIERRPPSKITITGLRKSIAAKLTEVKQTAPHFYLSVEINVSKLLEMRADINKDNEAKQTPKISVNDLIIKATALAFRDMPEANVSWQNGHIDQYSNVDASVAVAVEGGIFTPIIKDADHKSVFEISKEVKVLVARAKAGQLRSDEFLDGSFTISNLGMYGIDNFTAILNSPQSCIFAIGAAKKAPVVKDDKILVGSIMNITISCDHRVIDGAICAQIMNKAKSYLENPFKLLI